MVLLAILPTAITMTTIAMNKSVMMAEILVAMQPARVNTGDEYLSTDLCRTSFG